MTAQLVIAASGSLVLLCWIMLGIGQIVRFAKRGPRTHARRNAAWIGILLQGLGFAAVFAVRREHGLPIAPLSEVAGAFVSVLAFLIAVGSVWLIQSSIKALGRQWAWSARVVENHQLVTAGPYAVIRNPIYLGMLGMLVASGLSYGRWSALAAGVFIYLLGTLLRVRAEERLLREMFSLSFDEYVRRVPALFPRFRLF